MTTMRTPAPASGVSDPERRGAAAPAGPGRPAATAAFAGAVLFFWIGVFEAVYLLFFQGAMMQVAGMADWVKMLASLDTGLLLLAGLLYALPGALLGLAWWALALRLQAALRRLRHKPPRVLRDFFDLYSYVGLSLFFLLSLVGLLYAGSRLGTAASRLPLPVRVVLDGLVLYGLFRGTHWVLNQLLSLPLVRILRRPAVHGVAAVLTLALLAGLVVVPARFVPPAVRPAAEQIYFPQQSPPIVVVVLDTCRADHFGCYGYPRPTTPTFDALAQESVLFRNAISESPWTLPAHASMFTGLYPRTHGASISHFRLDSPYFTLAEFLRASGYYTFGLSANTMVGRVTNLDQGFDRFEEVWRTEGRDSLTLVKRLNRLRGQFPDKGARKINLLVEEWLDRDKPADRPFFLFINYLEVHGPYSAPPEFRERFLSRDRPGKPPTEINIYDDRFVKYLTGEAELSELELDDLRSMYDAELAYEDMQLGGLVELLRRHGILDQAILIVLADHGENLGEHRMTDHQLCVYDTLLRIPFLIRAPSLFPTGKEIQETVQHNSLFPTIADILGVAESQIPVAFQGQSLVPVIRHGQPGVQTAFSEYGRPTEILKILQYKAPGFDTSVFDRDLVSGRNGREKYIYTSNGTDELYRLLQDPGEENNLCRSQACGEREPLRRAISAWMASIPAYEAREQAGAISDQKDKEALQKLRSLGYVQ